MRKHPVSTYIFIWSFDMAILILFIHSIMNIPQFSIRIWIDFLVWSIIVCLARLGGLFKLKGFKASTGWGTSIELAGALILPFSLYSTAIFMSAIIITATRVRKKKSEPFLGPDFNACSTIFAALIMGLVRDKIYLLLSATIFQTIIPLLFAALTFSCSQIVLLTILMTIDTGVSFKKVGSLSKDLMITESVLVISGAALGRVYQLDPFSILLLIIPLFFLHGILEKSNEAKLVYVDEKTGLYNYRFFDKKLSELYNKACQSQQSLTMVFGDMDNLRVVNNSYGHQVGDRALIAVAKVLKEKEGDNSLAIRFGGEEFILLLANCDKLRGLEIAEQVRRTINATSITLDGGEQLQLSISFGVASYPEDADTVDKLIKASDLALYAAKHCGRNQVKAYIQNYSESEVSVSN